MEGSSGTRVGASALVAIVLVLSYLIYSRPYIGHASSFEPSVKRATMFDRMDGLTSDWQVSDAGVQLTYSGGSLHLTYSESPIWFYSLSRSARPEALAGDTLRLSARSNAATTLFSELEEAGGARYRTWADLVSGEWQTIVFGGRASSTATSTGSPPPVRRI